jgi:hypothetical protein
MDELERQQFVREQRERAKREAKKAREGLARRREALGEDLLEQREGREQPQTFRAEGRHDRGVLYKTLDNSAPATVPAADTDERIADERQFIFDVVAECLAEERARHRAEIESLSNKVDDLKRAFFNTPRDLVESTRELRAALADVRTVLERARSDPPLDMPALPRDLN